MAKILDAIKNDLKLKIGKKVLLKANCGRKKLVERSGILAEIYPSVFVVQLANEGQSFERVSYSYADILTETVEIIFEEPVVEILA